MTIGPSAPVSDVDRFARMVAGLERRIADLERVGGRDIGGLPMFSSRYVSVPTAWVQPAWTNSWTSATPDHFYYRKEGDVLRLTGIARGGVINLAIFTLPVGFRPLQTTTKVVVSSAGTSQLTIWAAGAVSVNVGGGGSYAILDSVWPLTAPIT